jgi:hypothetical protein
MLHWQRIVKITKKLNMFRILTTLIKRGDSWIILTTSTDGHIFSKRYIHEEEEIPEQIQFLLLLHIINL